jgi:hypothetical protein
MANILYTNAAAITLANLVRTALEDCELKLYQPLDEPLSVSTTKAMLEDKECDFSGYAAKTVDAADILASYLAPGGGANFQIATQQFDHDGGATANTVAGFYILTDGGDLFLAGEFDEPVAMQAAGESIPLDVVFNYGA